MPEARSSARVVRLAHQNNRIGLLKLAGLSVELALQTMIIVTGLASGYRGKTKKKVQKEITSIAYPYVHEAIAFAHTRAMNRRKSK